MAETAAHLVDCVIPPVPVRQWVLSLPRLLLAAQPQLLAPLLHVIHRRLLAFSTRGRVKSCILTFRIFVTSHYVAKDGSMAILRCAYFQAHTFSFLQISDDLKEVASLRIAFRAEHLHEAL
jgi:hypothetical protein